MSGTPLDSLIPHRPPMQLIEAVLFHDTEQLWAATTPHAGSPFAHPRGVPACIGLEYLAQATAAFFTLQAQPGQPPRQGMLIACPEFSTQQSHYALTQPLLLQVRRASRIIPDSTRTGLVKFHGAIYAGRLPASPTREALAGVKAQTAVSTADLSVYL